MVPLLLATDLCQASDPMDACVTSYEQAQKLRKAGDLLASKAQLEACMFPRCPNVLRRDCKQWLKEVEAATPSFLVDGRDPAGHEAELEVLLDGQPITPVPDTPIPVNPGPHVFEVRSGGAFATTYRVVARPGEKGRRLHVVIPPRIPRPVWVLAGVGLAEVGIATYFFVRGHRSADDCSPNCTSDDAEATRVANTAAGISLGMAALSLGAAGWMYWTRPRAAWTEPVPATTAPKVGVRMGPDGSMIELSGQF
jgi:hypothetical protein